ncbi:D-glycerate dehydrogenase [candidate division WOR-3 bacterium]|nr:D-glycerate dehydrogenase [candidate division WOR-3 bacterium]
MIPGAGLDILKKYFGGYQLPTDPTQAIPREELCEKIKGKDALLCLLTDKIDSEVLRYADNLRIIANYAVGFDNIDLKSAGEKKILVTNTPGVLTEATADLTFALLLSVVRRITEADRFVRQGNFKGWAPELLIGGDLNGKILGIIGLGRIGRAVAKRASCFGMRIVYHSRTRDEDFEKSYGAEFQEVEDLIRQSDIVTLHAPLTKETYHMIDAKKIGQMKRNAYIVNTARGPLIDEKSLCEALKNRAIAGAALDVFEREPEVERDLMELKNVVLAPHIGSASKETRDKMAIIAAESIVRYFEGELPYNSVNPEVTK